MMHVDTSAASWIGAGNCKCYHISRSLMFRPARRVLSTMTSQVNDSICSKHNYQSARPHYYDRPSTFDRELTKYPNKPPESNQMKCFPKIESPSCGTFKYRPLVPGIRQESQINHEAFDTSNRSNHDDLIDLFNFYVSALGKEEGMRGLYTALSNPDREICLPSKRNDHCHSDIFEARGVCEIFRLLRDKKSKNEQIFAAYKVLPYPGVAYLSEQSRGILLHRFAKPTRIRKIDSLRYLSLIDDMTEASLYLSPSLWTAAIHMAGKSSFWIQPSNLRAALGVWRRMEHQGKLSSSSVTFNILFDISIKAGQFKVAERIEQEMKTRGLNFSRCGKVARIFLCGLLGDSTGVRRTYNDFVRSGEVVDTVVLNCVMVSLIRSGECDLAEQMYERMKDLHQHVAKRALSSGDAKIYPSPSDSYVAYRKASKKLGRILGMTAYLYDRLPEHHRAIQSVLPLTADARTFHILLSYHAHRTGNLDRFAALLDDMKLTFEMPPQGMIYIFLFQGFAIHGGHRNSEWTLLRLKDAWGSFLRALNDSKIDTMSKKRSKLRKAKLSWENPLNPKFPFDMETAPSPLRDTSTSKNITSPDMPMYDRTDTDVLDIGQEWQYENTVYLGRRIIISALYAFSVCGGPQSVMETWQQVDKLWKLDSQKMADIIAVRKVLQKLVPGYVHR